MRRSQWVTVRRGEGREGEEETMRCLSCEECYEEANETEEELKRENEEIRAANTFLKFCSPVDHHNQHTRAPYFSDVVLVACSVDPSVGPSVPVPAHKFVLASRSPVFKAMLENEMEESWSDTIKISDVSYDALRAFVNFFYTAEAFLDEKMACDLLVLAEKYNVKHLKAYCEKFLVSRLKWENSMISYAFARQHNAKHVRDAALSLITDNMDELSKRGEYGELVEKDPRLLLEIYEAFVSKRVNTAAHKDSSVKP